MIVHYRLIQFREDPLRGEGRNIAVIAWTGSRAHIRAIGVDPFGNVEFSAFGRLLPDAMRTGAWVYAEWVERWADLVRRCEGNGEALAAELERLEEISGAAFVAAEGGEADVAIPSSPRPFGIGADPDLVAARAAADRLYDRLVAGGMAGGLPVPFLEAVDAVLSMSEVRYQERFQRDETFAIGASEEAEAFLFFPYFLDGPNSIGAKLVCFNGPPWDAVVASVNDTIFTFDTAVSAGLLERRHCLALVDDIRSVQPALVARLAQAATLIDVTASDAASQLSALVRGEG